MSNILIYCEKNLSLPPESFPSFCETVCFEDRNCLSRLLVQSAKQASWVTIVREHDVFSAEYWEKAWSYLQNTEASLVFTAKLYGESKEKVPFADCDFSPASPDGLLSKQELVDCHSFQMGGTFIKASHGASFGDYLSFGDFAEMLFLLDLQKKLKTAFLPSLEYQIGKASYGEPVFSREIYEKDSYQDLILIGLAPYLENCAADGSLSENSFLAYHALYLLNFLIEANIDNASKRLFSEDEARELLSDYGRVLALVPDEVILDEKHFKIKDKNPYLRRYLYLLLKYPGEEIRFTPGEWEEGKGLGYRGLRLCSLEEARVNIQSMEYGDGLLKIDGTAPPFFFSKGCSFGIKTDEGEIPLEIRERYSHTKAFGTSIYKTIAFHAEVPLESGKKNQLAFLVRMERKKFKACLSFESHFSRLTDRFAHSYWKADKKTMLFMKKNVICVKGTGFLKTALREAFLYADMLKTGKKGIIKYIPVRLFMHCEPIFKRKPVWLFIDKIYKAGDSSEYLYHYVKEHDDSVDCYYLLDSKCPDYKRMTADGDKPLVRRSLKHRFMFLYSDWIIISNSTVFAFNDFSTKNSAYLRDLFHFKVACVQHGMSVQKIAVAQNRLRDNISLYFCASRYEIENLMKPVYDYDHYDILKLTGVPRYDGLVDRRKKQIMISPTWRMQAAVPVKENESVARDYNPLFRESSYYKVFNSLINDPRLIRAAKEYGYRIKYVLHPIVSPQAGDFETNDYVDIVPATGDMSYEDMFCESSLMVTDFSGIQFDFAYMRKPVVYLHHRDIPKHYEEGTYHYDTMAFGEICSDNDELISLLCDYMRNDCQMKELYRKRADDFFAFDDHDNCRRIYEIMKEYMQ